MSIARDVLSDYGFSYRLNTPAGTIEKTRSFHKEAGFKNIEIREEKNGYYVPWEQAKNSWISIDDFAPGQHPHPVSKVPPDLMNLCQDEYLARIKEFNLARIKEFNSDKGV